MRYPVENIHLSEQERDQLVKLKRYTGLKHWNVLCRWGFCVSIADALQPPDVEVRADSSVEMTWKTFTGRHDVAYEALLKQRCRVDGIDPTDDALVARVFRLHLMRGIGYLAGDRTLRGVDKLIAKATECEVAVGA